MSFKALPSLILATVVLMVWLLGAAAQAADGPITPGGDITVDGHPLQGHFLRQGNGMLFPIVELAKALGKTAEISGSTATIGVLSAPVVMQDGVAYVSYLGVRTLLPSVAFGATATRAVFTTHVATTPTHTPPHPTASGSPAAGQDVVSIIGMDANVDATRGNLMTIEVTLQNNTATETPNLKVSLQIIDPSGITGTPGKPNLYAQYDEELKLGPNGVQTVTYKTTVADPQNINDAAQSFTVTLNHISIDHQTDVDLVWKINVTKDE